MTELQQVLISLASTSQQIIVSQLLINDILAKEAQGISPATRELLARNNADDMKRLQLLGEASRLIAHIE